MTGVGLTASPADAATSMVGYQYVDDAPQVTYPRWVALGTYSTTPVAR